MASIYTACRDIKELHPLAQEACYAFLEACEAQGCNIFITETYRSQDRQNWLYASGRTRAGAILTSTLSSRHTSRMAWDIACGYPHSLYDNDTLCQAGKIAQELGITWGGSWTSFVDKPHFEINTKWTKPTTKQVEVVRYQTIDHVPVWGKVTIEKLITKKIFADEHLLNITNDMLRILVFHDRMGLYD